MNSSWRSFPSWEAPSRRERKRFCLLHSHDFIHDHQLIEWTLLVYTKANVRVARGEKKKTFRKPRPLRGTDPLWQQGAIYRVMAHVKQTFRGRSLAARSAPKKGHRTWTSCKAVKKGVKWDDRDACPHSGHGTNPIPKKTVHWSPHGLCQPPAE